MQTLSAIELQNLSKIRDDTCKIIQNEKKNEKTDVGTTFGNANRAAPERKSMMLGLMNPLKATEYTYCREYLICDVVEPYSVSKLGSLSDYFRP